MLLKKHRVSIFYDREILISRRLNGITGKNLETYSECLLEVFRAPQCGYNRRRRKGATRNVCEYSRRF